MRDDSAFGAAIDPAVSAFGHAVAEKLRGPGDPEDQLRSPTEHLIRVLAAARGLKVVMHGEVRLVDINARPDYRVDVAGAPIGYIEIKKDGQSIDPSRFRGHNARQWEKLRLLPNVLYSNGNEWALYRDGKRVGDVAKLHGPIRTAGRRLRPVDDGFRNVLSRFLLWKPSQPRTINQLVEAVANLCQLLRLEVSEALSLEASNRRPAMFEDLAADWRKLLFPEASNDSFADHYAQTVTFALLLARVEGISFDGEGIQTIARQLGKKHSVMGKALAVLTENPDHGLGTTLDTLLHVIGAVNWDKFGDSESTYLRLYADFLKVYDPMLREKTGAYYTPEAIVDFMVRTSGKLLDERLGRSGGFANRDVMVVDPAMGTGAFLASIIGRIANVIGDQEGIGAIPSYLREAVGTRLVGFEVQSGPFAVSEIRLHDCLQKYRAEAPSGGLRIYMADTLDDPYIKQTALGSTYEPIARSRRLANSVKRDEPVMVVIGNPPYDAVKSGRGKWIENGGIKLSDSPPLDAFRIKGNGRYEYVLTNLHVYFWRWATWKVFDQPREDPRGIVAFITPSAYLHAQGFAGMREYLRRTTDEGWVIDLTPEGHEPDIPTRVFKDVRQPLCIGIFVRYGASQPKQAARIHYVAIRGRREEKFRQLGRLSLDDTEWRKASITWTAPFLPRGKAQWAQFLALDDIFPWTCRGVTTGRMWVYAPDQATLFERWRMFLGADRDERRALLRESRDRTLDTRVESLFGVEERAESLGEETGSCLPPVRVGFRAFDRQWLIPDSRLMAVPRPDLWRVRGPRQVYAYELHTKPPTAGPALTFSAEIPDLHFYRGNNGGHALPLYRDLEGRYPNVAPDLLDYLSRRLGLKVSAEDLLAYVACLISNSEYTRVFSMDLQVPGTRVPLTADPGLWQQGVALGGEVIWLHTYGERFHNSKSHRRRCVPKLPSERRPRVIRGIPDSVDAMPDRIQYEAETRALTIGSGLIAPVSSEVWDYEVSGMKVVRKWFGYRKRSPAGQRPGDLDKVTSQHWPSSWTTELLDLLNVLQLVVDKEPLQADLLHEVCSRSLITVTELQDARVLPLPEHWKKPMGSRGATLFDRDMEE